MLTALGLVKLSALHRRGNGLREGKGRDWSHTRFAGSWPQMLLRAPLTFAPARGWGERWGAVANLPTTLGACFQGDNICPWEPPWDSRHCVPTPSTNPPAHC